VDAVAGSGRKGTSMLGLGLVMWALTQRGAAVRPVPYRRGMRMRYPLDDHESTTSPSAILHLHPDFIMIEIDNR